MMKKTILLLMAAVLLAGGLRAQTPEFTASVKKLLAVSGGDATLKMVPEQMSKMIEQQASNLPPSVMKEIRDMFDEKELTKLVDQMIPLYAKYYTQDDLNQLIAFYETPLGKKLAETQPRIAMESIEISQKWAAEIGQKIYQKMMQSNAGGDEE